MSPRKQRRRAGLKDVAALAGTSTATVSRALNGSGFVAPETLKRILEATKQLSYQPNLRAKGLRQRSSHSIGLVIPNLLNPYYIRLADAASQLLTQAGYYLLLSATRDDPAIQQGILDDMIGLDVDGLIWAPAVPAQALLDHLRSQHIPTVSIVRRVPGDSIDTVVFEDFKGSCAAMQHLLDLGHRRIGYISSDVSHSSNNARWQGYQTSLRQANLPVEQELIKLGAARSTWGEVATLDLLRLPSPPTAFYVASNPMMPGVLKTLRQYGLAIPGDISLICFDDLDWFSFSVPPITAISISPIKLAHLAVDLLLRRIKDADGLDKPPVFMEINFELVLRSSTGPPRATSLVLPNIFIETLA
jgi:LacI family transcriptional regulator